MIRQGLGFHPDQHKFIETLAKKRKVAFSHVAREVVQAGIDAMKKKA